MSSKVDLSQLPPAAVAVSLIPAATFAAMGGMSPSWLDEKVRQGLAPQPVIRQPRCTRWRLEDAIAFWKDFAEAGAADTDVGARMSLTAKAASDRARDPAAVAKAAATRKTRAAARRTQTAAE